MCPQWRPCAHSPSGVATVSCRGRAAWPSLEWPPCRACSLLKALVDANLRQHCGCQPCPGLGVPCRPSNPLQPWVWRGSEIARLLRAWVYDATGVVTALAHRVEVCVSVAVRRMELCVAENPVYVCPRCCSSACGTIVDVAGMPEIFTLWVAASFPPPRPLPSTSLEPALVRVRVSALQASMPALGLRVCMCGRACIVRVRSPCTAGTLKQWSCPARRASSPCPLPTMCTSRRCATAAVP
jgi:hypothetical protein